MPFRSKYRPGIGGILVSGAYSQSGTAFHIGAGLLLTNWHVLYVRGNAPTAVTAEFGYEFNSDDEAQSSIPDPCDLRSVRADKADAWGVIRMPQALANSLTALSLDQVADPVLQAAAFIIQHPGGDRKRIAYVRNQITDFDDRAVHYFTQQGSSVAPVFDDQGRLVALHRVGRRPQEVSGKPPLKKNEGIRMTRVVSGLKAVGIL